MTYHLIIEIRRETALELSAWISLNVVNGRYTIQWYIGLKK